MQNITSKSITTPEITTALIMTVLMVLLSLPAKSRKSLYINLIWTTIFQGKKYATLRRLKLCSLPGGMDRGGGGDSCCLGGGSSTGVISLKKRVIS